MAQDAVFSCCAPAKACALCGACCDGISTEKVGGAVTRALPELERLLEHLRKGDMLVVCKRDRLALAQEAGFAFSAEEFNEMAETGEIDIDQTLSYIAKAYESRGIRLFVRSGTGLFA